MRPAPEPTARGGSPDREPADFNPYSRSLLADPYPAYRRLQIEPTCEGRGICSLKVGHLTAVDVSSISVESQGTAHHTGHPLGLAWSSISAAGLCVDCIGRVLAAVQRIVGDEAFDERNG